MSTNRQFGSGRTLDDVRRSLATFSVEQIREREGDAFLLVHASDVAGGSGETNKTRGSVAAVAEAGRTTSYVFVVKKRLALSFSFIAVGRNEGNDLHLPHASMSRFHAFFRAMNGEVLLLDAKSSNGTFCDAVRVPKQGEGDPVRVRPGALLRFGDLACVFVDAAGLKSALE